MENREFIAANELPEIEAETVDVLCVNPETGEMGKKSGAALGGSGGYILKPTVEEIAPGGNKMIIITADCTDMVKAIETGANVMILFPAGVLGEGVPTVLFTIAMWRNVEGALMGNSGEGGFVFPNAPIPSFLQG